MSLFELLGLPAFEALQEISFGMLLLILVTVNVLSRWLWEFAHGSKLQEEKKSVSSVSSASSRSG